MSILGRIVFCDHITCSTIDGGSCQEGINHLVVSFMGFRVNATFQDFFVSTRAKRVQRTGLPFCPVVLVSVKVRDAFCRDLECTFWISLCSKDSRGDRFCDSVTHDCVLLVVGLLLVCSDYSNLVIRWICENGIVYFQLRIKRGHRRLYLGMSEKFGSFSLNKQVSHVRSRGLGTEHLS